MIVDTSAIMAIILDEPEAEHFATRMATAASRRVSAGTWIELSAVLTRRKDPRLDKLFDAFNAEAALTIEPVTAEQARIGWDAYRNYGIGTNEKARLNFGDCFAYALAKATGESLLYKGEDFARTDIPAAA